MNFGQIWIPKIVIFSIIETWEMFKISKKSKFRTFKSGKNDISYLFEFTKIWFHVKSEWQANLKISHHAFLTSHFESFWSTVFSVEIKKTFDLTKNLIKNVLFFRPNESIFGRESISPKISCERWFTEDFPEISF